MAANGLKGQDIILHSGHNGPCKKALKADQIYLPKRLLKPACQRNSLAVLVIGLFKEAHKGGDDHGVEKVDKQRSHQRNHEERLE